ncbi:TetR family transcriptional regulator [Planotetraspora thailandica]|uniref:TetR family transcriptional regulator n=1 Tax=Planotetraspora thailandica TaxID=487172 RepID=A0A8J3V7K8_9ACTN|nr:TetR/AcrR family transcriptional regulator [Planotetraspora thailandica]GII56386.1 TetR family transcriptional regulator [Planotetraspora thailandica]
MGRDYRGMSAAERLADRRERLITAAYTLFAHPGFHATTIERLCAAARISNRAFYECFSSRDDLMHAVYQRCVDETITVVTTAIDRAPASLDDRIVAGIAEYVNFVTKDARRARLMHLEVRRAGSVLTMARQHTVKAFTEIIEGVAKDAGHPLPRNVHMLSLGLIGAVTELLIEWVLADPTPSTDVVIDTAVHIFHRSFGL